MVEKCEDTKRVMKNKTEHRRMTDNTMAKKKDIRTNSDR